MSAIQALSITSITNRSVPYNSLGSIFPFLCLATRSVPPETTVVDLAPEMSCCADLLTVPTLTRWLGRRLSEVGYSARCLYVRVSPDYVRFQTRLQMLALSGMTGTSFVSSRG